MKHAFYTKRKKSSTDQKHQFHPDRDTDAFSRNVEMQSAVYDDYTRIEWNDLLSDLTELERRAIVGIYKDGYTAAALARIYGCSRQCVNQAKKRGLAKLKSRLLDEHT